MRSLTEGATPKLALDAPGGRNRRGAASSSWASLAFKLPPQVYAAACLAAVTIAIIVNAAFFQRSPRPADFAPPVTSIAPDSRTSATTQSAPQPSANTAAADSQPVLPPVRPVRSASAPGSAANSADDAIADLINGGSSRDDGRKLIMAAQSALAKLGYAVKVDGDANAATMQAIGDYEKRHNLPPSTAIGPRIVKTLTAAANAGAR